MGDNVVRGEAQSQQQGEPPKEKKGVSPFGRQITITNTSFPGLFLSILPL